MRAILPNTVAASRRMARRFLGSTAACAIALGALTALSAPAAQAGETDDAAEPFVLGCSARKEMVAHLENRYGEVFSGKAKKAERGLVELFVAETGSWTILLTLPDGQSCPLAVGSDAERDFKRADLLGRPV